MIAELIKFLSVWYLFVEIGNVGCGHATAVKPRNRMLVAVRIAPRRRLAVASRRVAGLGEIEDCLAVGGLLEQLAARHQLI